jgi:endoglucanase Acf2
MKTIQLKTPKEIVTKESVTVNNVSLNFIIDDMTKVVATITISDTNLNQIQLVLWDGQDYINIGQYTDEDITTRIIELI